MKTLRIALKFGQKTPELSNHKKLCEGIPLFEIGKILKIKLDRKISKQQIAISKIPDKPRLKSCRNLLVRSVLLPDFLKEIPT